MLKIDHITKTFNPGTVNAKTAISDLSLHLEKGDFVTIIGSNGAGKSTLFNSIAGNFYVDEGSITLDGENITYVREHIRSKVVGRMFQDPLKGTAPNMTIEENLALAKRRGCSRTLRIGITKSEREEYHELLKLLDSLTPKVQSVKEQKEPKHLGDILADNEQNFELLKVL